MLVKYFFLSTLILCLFQTRNAFNVTVTGVATFLSPNNVTVLNVALSATAKNASDAFANLSNKVSQVLNATNNQNISASDTKQTPVTFYISGVNYGVDLPVEPFIIDGEAGNPNNNFSVRTPEVTAMTSVNIKVRNPGDNNTNLAQLVDSLLTIEDVSISTSNFENTNATDVYSQSYQESFADAQVKALIIASLTNTTVVGVQEIQQSSTPYGPGVPTNLKVTFNLQ